MWLQPIKILDAYPMGVAESWTKARGLFQPTLLLPGLVA